MADRNAKGRQARGERQASARLTSDLVREIRASGMLDREIAAKYGISRSHANHVRIGRKWAHLNGER